jgi:hypothetical protein
MFLFFTTLELFVHFCGYIKNSVLPRLDAESRRVAKLLFVSGFKSQPTFPTRRASAPAETCRLWHGWPSRQVFIRLWWIYPPFIWRIKVSHLILI